MADKEMLGDALLPRKAPSLTETAMILSKLSQIIFLGICAGSFICGDANGQIIGTATMTTATGTIVNRKIR